MLADACDSNRNVAVIKLKQVDHVNHERSVLADVAGYPFITTLITSFSDHDSLYMLVSLWALSDSRPMLMRNLSLITALAAKYFPTSEKLSDLMNPQLGFTQQK